MWEDRYYTYIRYYYREEDNNQQTSGTTSTTHHTSKKVAVSLRSAVLPSHAISFSHHGRALSEGERLAKKGLSVTNGNVTWAT